MSNKKTFGTPYGTTINVYYLEKLEETCDINHILSCLNDLYFRLFKYFGPDPWAGYTLNIWDDRCPDIPRTHTECGNDGVCWIVPGIGDGWSGLTWQDKEKTDIHDNNINFSDKNEYFECLISHEFFHLLAWKMGFNDLNNKLLPFWKLIAGGDDAERIAEYGKKLHGCFRAKNNPVRESWGQPETKKGVRDFLLIWQAISSFMKTMENSGYIVFDISHHFSDWDTGYIGFLFHCKDNQGKVTGFYYDRIGRQQYFQNTNSWQFTYKF